MLEALLVDLQPGALFSPPQSPCSPAYFRALSLLCPAFAHPNIRSTTDPTAQNFFPVSSAFKPDELNGQLEPKDNEWTCAGGFVTETQIWYTILDDGSSLMCQIIHSSVGCAPFVPAYYARLTRTQRVVPADPVHI
jgi:hypothetical protein